MLSDSLSMRVTPLKDPTKIFHSCPRCLSPNVLKLDGEVLCTYCEWDTVGLQASLQNPTRTFKTTSGEMR